MPDEKKNRMLDVLASAAGIEEPIERSRKYRSIVGILLQEAVRIGDRWYLEEAIRTAGLVTDDPGKAYVEVIRAMAKIGTNKKDEQILSEAVKITGRIGSDLDLSVALHELAVAFAKIGIDKNDENIFSRSLDLAEKIPLNTYHSSALRNASRMRATKDPKKALELLEVAISLIEKSEGTEPVYLIHAYCDIASMLSMLGDNRSRGFIRRAIVLAGEITDDFEKSAVLLRILETENAIGIKEKDESLLKEAAALSEKITKEYYKTLALNAIKTA